MTLPVFTVFVLLVYVLFYGNVVNIANYSVLMYTFSGFPKSGVLYDLIKYSRLPVMLLGTLAIITVLPRNRALRSYLLKNYDLLLFAAVLYLGLFNAIDLVNGVLYSIWHTAAIICTLSFLFYLKNRYSEQEAARTFLQFLFWSNFIVLPLLYINLHTLGSDWSYYMAFSSKTFYPYCLLAMMLSTFSCRILIGKSILSYSRKTNFILELILVCSILFFCFVSARRTPLFLMVITSFIYLYLILGTSLIKKAGILLLILCFMAYTIPKALDFIEKNKHEMSVLKKLNDIQESGGHLEKDSSYGERELIWSYYWKIFYLHPIVGVGAYNGPIYQSKLCPVEDLKGYSSHNLYLGMLVEHGILGFAFFVLVLLRSLWIYLKRFGFWKTITLGVFLVGPMLLINWNEYNLIPGQVFYWSTILILCFARIYKD